MSINSTLLIRSSRLRRPWKRWRNCETKARSADWIGSTVTQEHIERGAQNRPHRFGAKNRYSFADREWDYVVDYCERNGIAFIPWFSFGGGRVAGDVLERIAAVRTKPHPCR